jgi:hypothetical protein
MVGTETGRRESQGQVRARTKTVRDRTETARTEQRRIRDRTETVIPDRDD